MPIPRSGTAAALATGALVTLAPTAALGAAQISGSDGQVWNAASPTPSFEITSDRGNGTIFWVVQGVASGVGRGRAEVNLPGLADGAYRLLALEDSGRVFEIAQRSFRVDVTAPTLSISSPVAGAQIALGAEVRAAFTCDGAVRCEAAVPPGGLLDTSRPGPASLSVRAEDDAGNVVTQRVDYSVVAPRPAASALAVPPPRTLNARSMRPRAGVRVTSRRPTLRWRPRPGVALYNVQVFRMRSGTATKVLSAFPRGSRYRLPARRLAFGGRYLWRVWPQVGGRYLESPLGLSYFDVRAAPRR